MPNTPQHKQDSSQRAKTNSSPSKRNAFIGYSYNEQMYSYSQNTSTRYELYSHIQKPFWQSPVPRKIVRQALPRVAVVVVVAGVAVACTVPAAPPWVYS